MQNIIETVINYFVIVTVINIIMNGLPIPKISKDVRKRTFFVESNNRFEYQKNRECSGYATAYALRHLGVEADGLTSYNSIPIKLLHGNVPGLGIFYLCMKNKVRVRLRIGNVNALKNSLTAGNPIVVLTRSVVGSNSLHYINVVGYDESHIYAVDSIESHKNVENDFYNRIIPIEDFKKIWRTSMIYQPFFFHLFFEISKK